MDFENIITLVGSAVGGGGIVQLINWRASKRKAKAEAKSDEIENLRKTIDAVYLPLIKQLKGDLAEVKSEVKDVREENAALRLENARLRRELDEIKRECSWRNTNRGKDGKFASVKKEQPNETES